jgi:hypothetical protein
MADLQAAWSARACRAGLFAAALAAPPTGCLRAKRPLPAPEDGQVANQAKCSVAVSQTRPLIVEWPAADRAALESRAQQGIVAVRYTGCEMEVLTMCRMAGDYRYRPLTQKREGVTIKTLDELYLALPVGAAGLEAKLAAAEQLNILMVVAGRLEAPDGELRRADLVGRCDGATHVITGITTGAFVFYTGNELSGKVEVKVGHVGAGGGALRKREVLAQDGDEEACIEDPQADVAAPPHQCGALLRVEVAGLDGEATVAAPPVDPRELDRRQRRYTRSKDTQKAGTVLLGLVAVPAALLVGGQVAAGRAQDDYDGASPERRPEEERRGAAANVLTVVGLAGVGAFLVVGASLVIASKALGRRGLARALPAPGAGGALGWWF